MATGHSLSLPSRGRFVLSNAKLNQKGRNEIQSNRIRQPPLKQEGKTKRNQILLKSLSTGELMSSTTVTKMTKIVEGTQTPEKIFTFSDIPPTQNPEPVAPTASCDFVEVEDRDPDTNDEEKAFSVVQGSRSDKRRFSATEITPTQNSDKQARVQIQSNRETGDGGSGFPVYVRCVDPRVDITTLNPVKVKKEIIDQFHVSGLIQKAGQSLRVFCSTESQRNQFLQTGIIILNYRVVCSLPYRKTEPREGGGRQGTVRKVIGRVSAQVTDEELCKATGADSALRIPVRLRQTQAPGATVSQRDTGVMTSAVILSYPNGKTPPAQADLGWQTCRLMPYVPEPRRCYKCQKFGHTAKFCKKQQPVCPVCSEEHQYEECTNKDRPKCANCTGTHSASYRKCTKYIEVKKILTRVSETGESFRDAKQAIIGSGGVDQGPVVSGVQGAPISTPQSRLAHSYAAAASTTNTRTSTANNTHTVEVQTDIPLVSPVVSGGVVDSREGEISPSLSQNCSCVTSGTLPNMTKFLILAIQLILQTVQDKELAEKLSSSIKKSAAELLGFTDAETQAAVTP